MKPVTWQDIVTESRKDQDIIGAVRFMMLGPDKVEHQLSAESIQLIRLRHYISVKDDVLLYKDRPIIPKSLRQRVLSILHSAHQGITGMMLRAEEAIFWPNITRDIKSMRLACSSCDKSMPSQSNLPPVDPVIPQFPFQHICADYMQLAGHSYGIIVDRFSNWFQIYAAKGGSWTFVKILRDLIEKFNVPETLTTDGGSQYIAEETQTFLN